MSKVVDMRRVELAKIHIAKQQLGLDDEVYKQMLWTVARVESSADLDTHGRRKVIEHLKSRGFIDNKKRKYLGRPHNTDTNAQIQKIEAMLADGKLPWSYADSMAKHMFKVDRVTFCNAEQLQKLIAALIYQRNRGAKRDVRE
jgi:phage gp16-like protein